MLPINFDVHRANCKPLAITRAVTNLCDNAVKFAQVVTVELEELRDSLRISVVDDGPGIPEELHSRVFEPFFKGDPARASGKAGFGLGLSIVADIVSTHRGRIELRGREPHGLIVRMLIPTNLTSS